MIHLITTLRFASEGDMSGLPKRDKLDPKQALAMDFVAAQEGSFYIKGEARTGKV